MQSMYIYPFSQYEGRKGGAEVFFYSPPAPQWAPSLSRLHDHTQTHHTR